MPQLTLGEKLSVLFDNILAYPLFLGLLIIPVIAFFLKNKKFNKIVITLYIVVAGIILGMNLKNIPALLDNLVEYIITIMNFPTMGLVLAVVIFEIVVIIMTIVKNYRTEIKIINGISFILVQIMFGITLMLVNNTKIDFTKQNNLYNSLDITTMMQMIMMTFALQLGLLFVSKCIDKVTLSLEGTKEIVTNSELVIEEETNEKTSKITSILDKMKFKKNNKVNENTESDTLVEPLNFDEILPTPKPKNVVNRAKSKQIVSNVKEDNNTDEFTYTMTHPVVIDRVKSKQIRTNVKEEVKKVIKPVNYDEYVNADAIRHEKTMSAVSAKVSPILDLPIEPAPTIKTEVTPIEENQVQKLEIAPAETKMISEVKEIENPVSNIEIGKVNNVKVSKNDIADLAARIDNIDVSSNKFLTEETKRSLEAELLAYKEQLLKYKEQQMNKKELLRKQMEEFSSVFNITPNDLKH